MNLSQLIFDKMVDSKKHPPQETAAPLAQVRSTPVKPLSADHVNAALDGMLRTAYNTTEHPITSGKRFPVGKALVFIRKVARKLFLRAYADPILHQQNQFNAAAFKAAEELKNSQLTLEGSFDALRGDTVHNVSAMDQLVRETRAMLEQTAAQLRAHEIYANGEITLHTQRDDDLAAALEALRVQLGDLDDRQATDDQALAQSIADAGDLFEARMDDMEDEWDDAFEDLHQRLADVDAALHAALTQQTSTAVSVGQLASRTVEQAEQALQRHEQLTGQLAAQAARADALQQRITDHESALQQRTDDLASALQQRTDDLASALQQRTDDLASALQQRMDSLEAAQTGSPDVTELFPRTDSLEQRLAAADAERSALLSALQQANARLDALEARAAAPAAPALPEGAHLTASQAGEDRIIEWVLAEGFGIRGEACTYLDVGANHAVHLSNTYRFYHQGARGVLVEANPALIDELRTQRPGDEVIHACVDHSGAAAIPFYCLSGDGLSTASEESARHALAVNPALSITDAPMVNTITMEEIVRRMKGKVPAILNVDVEGKELEVLQHLDLDTFRPCVVVTEMVAYQPQVALEKNQSLMDYMLAHDYHEFAYTGINSIFVDKRAMNRR